MAADPRLLSFAKAAQAAQGVNSMGGSPFGGGSEIRNIQAFNTPTFQVGAARGSMDAAGADAAIAAENEENAAEMARKKKIDELAAQRAKNEQRLKDLNDPNKFYKVIKEDGGYDFYNPEDEQIDVRTYAAMRNEHVDEVLKDSRNPSDQEFVKGYDQLLELGDIMSRGDKDALKKLYKEDPDLEKFTKGKTYDQIVSSFKQSNSRFFYDDKPAAFSAGTKKPEDISGGGGGFGAWLKSLLGS